MKRRSPSTGNLLLLLYPKRFRAKYGVEALRQLDSDLKEAGRAGRIRSLMDRLLCLSEFAVAGLCERVSSLSRRTSHDNASRRGSYMNSVAQDIRFGARSFIRAPLFTIVVVVSLALGVGANTAIFSVAKAVLFQPLPYAEPDRVVRILGTTEGELIPRNIYLAYPEIEDLRDQSEAFSEVSAVQWWDPIMYGDGEPSRISGWSVSASFFEIFGMSPALGRFFVPEEEQLGHEPVVVLSHALWQQRFGGDRDVVGRTIDFDGTLYSVVGVAPETFEDPFGSEPGMWRARPEEWDASRLARINHSWMAIGKLAEGVALEQAGADLDRIWDNFRAAYPDSHDDEAAAVRTAKDWMVGGVRTAVLVLLGAVGLVLLIACSNVASLLLARTASRSREVALRSALGANRGRIARQLITEVCLLFLIAGIAGLPVAWLGIDSLSALGAEDLPRFAEVGIDWAAMGFSLGVSLSAGIVFGLAAAYPSLRADLTTSLQEGGRGGSSDRKSQRLRGMLVVAELTVAVVLTAAGGLLLKSLWNLNHVDPGFRAENVLTLRVYPASGTHAGAAEITRLYQDLTQRLASLPGVSAAGAINFLPMWGGQNCEFVWRDDRPMPTTMDDFAEYDGPRCLEVRVVTPDYFRIMGIDVLRGRGFTPQDDEGAQPVAVISRGAAELGFRGEDPVGKRVTLYETRDFLPDISREVVGVVGDVRQTSVAAEGVPAIYFPHAQAVDPGRRRVMTLVAHTERDPNGSADLARGAVWEIDDNITIDYVQSMVAVRNSTVNEPRFRAILVLIFAGVALVLSTVGVAGIVSYAVSRRIREIGLRIALGASSRNIYVTVMSQGIKFTAVGLLLGICIAAVSTRVLSSLLYGVEATDPASFVAASLLFAIVAAVAIWIPARRALTVDPVTTLNSE